MEILQTIAATALPVFAIIGAGFVYGRTRRLPAAELTDLLVWILIPCLVLGSVGSNPLSLAEVGAISLSAGAVILGTGLLSLIVFPTRLRRAALLPVMFMNSANMAFPLALLAFGDAGLSRQVIFYIATNLLHSSVGIAIARGPGGLREVLKLPLVYAAGLALLMTSLGVKLPATVATPLSMVGKATIPIMLLLLGERLRAVNLRDVGPALLASGLRLFGGFAIGLLMVLALGLEGLPRAAVLLGASMPAAVLNFVLCERYELQPAFVASVVVLSTILSFGTTPLVLWYIQAIQAG